MIAMIDTGVSYKMPLFVPWQSLLYLDMLSCHHHAPAGCMQTHYYLETCNPCQCVWQPKNMYLMQWSSTKKH